MANEAVIVQLLGNGGDVISFTCADAPAIAKGTLLALDDPRTCSGANIGRANRIFAGIAAHEKVAGDGSTQISCYTYGIFDLYADGAINVGDLCILSGANRIAAATNNDVLSGAGMGRVVGKALETATATEVIQVLVGGVH